ncbi:MAG: YggT family protein [Gaiellales bacterium]
METVIQVLAAFLTIYTLCVFAWVLLSWLPMIAPQAAYNPTVSSIRRFLDSVVLPYIRLFRFIPPVRLGGQLLDLSALVAIIALSFGGRLIIDLLASVAGI